MRLLIFLSLISYNVFSQSVESCLKGDFSSKISNADFMWGMVNYELVISKNRCVITLKKDKFLKSEWKIDICREPIHIKAMQYFTNKEYIKEVECSGKSKNTFCKKTAELSRLLEKEALIHAKGEREDLDSEHGQVYCLYKLINEYLLHDEIFSMNKSYENALFHGVSFGPNKAQKMNSTFVEPVLTTTTSTTQSVYVTEDEIKEEQVDPVEESSVSTLPVEPSIEEVKKEVVDKAKAEAAINPEEAFNKAVDTPVDSPAKFVGDEEISPKIETPQPVEKLDSF